MNPAGKLSKQPDSFGQRLAHLRRNRGWKQAALASRIGVTVQQLSKYERGAHEPKLSVLLRMAEVLGRSLDYLVTGREGEPDPLSALWPALVQLPSGLRGLVAEFLKSVLKAQCLLDPPQEVR